MCEIFVFMNTNINIKIEINPSLTQFLYLQVQATVLGFLAALAASVLGWFLEEKITINYTALLCCSSVVTAFVASLLQGKNSEHFILNKYILVSG